MNVSSLSPSLLLSPTPPSFPFFFFSPKGRDEGDVLGNIRMVLGGQGEGRTGSFYFQHLSIAQRKFRIKSAELKLSQPLAALSNASALPPVLPYFAGGCVLKDRPLFASDSWAARRVGARGVREAPPPASISLLPKRDHGLSHGDFFNDENLLSLLMAGPS